MRNGKEIVSENQTYINYRMAASYYNEFSKTARLYICKSKSFCGDVHFDEKSLLNREYAADGECLQLYFLREKMIRLAEETSEFYCRAILNENGSSWKSAKSLGKNVLDCFNLLSQSDKKLIISIPIDYLMDSAIFYPLFIAPNTAIIADFDDDTPLISDYLQSFADGKMVDSLKAYYKNKNADDFNEQFVIALAKLLYSFVYTKHTRKITSKKNKSNAMFDFVWRCKD